MKPSLRLLSRVGLFVCAILVGRSVHAADPTTVECLNASESWLTMRDHHKLRDARAQLLICSAATCPADVRDECIRRVAEVNATIPSVIFEAEDPSGGDLAAVKVTMDGVQIADRLDGAALTLDPGEHTFTFVAAGKPTIRKRFVIREGEKDRRERIVFGPPSTVAVPTPAPEPTPIVGPSPSTPPGAEPTGVSTQRILAIVAAGIGVVGLGVGIGFGIDSMSKHDDAIKICPGTTCPDMNGVNLWNQAISAGTVSTVAFIVGAVGLTGGAALWFTAPSGSAGAEKAHPQVGLGLGTVQLKGVW